jgi:hypothetical protein
MKIGLNLRVMQLKTTSKLWTNHRSKPVVQQINCDTTRAVTLGTTLSITCRLAITLKLVTYINSRHYHTSKRQVIFHTPTILLLLLPTSKKTIKTRTCHPRQHANVWLTTVLLVNTSAFSRVISKTWSWPKLVVSPSFKAKPFHRADNNSKRRKFWSWRFTRSRFRFRPTSTSGLPASLTTRRFILL